jgi:hypothetical protein
MDSKIDPMGRAIADFWKTNKAAIEQEQSDADIDLTEREQLLCSYNKVGGLYKKPPFIWKQVG